MTYRGQLISTEDVGGLGLSDDHFSVGRGRLGEDYDTLWILHSLYRQRPAGVLVTVRGYVPAVGGTWYRTIEGMPMLYGGT